MGSPKQIITTRNIVLTFMPFREWKTKLSKKLSYSAYSSNNTQYTHIQKLQNILHFNLNLITST